MNLSPMAQATLLLTSDFSQVGSDDAKPLSNAEWGRFALWLKEKSATPADLLSANASSLLQGWQDSHIRIERVITLLNRGHSLALAIEKWQRAGLWLVTRSDSDYPWRLKQRLKTDSPPVLFGCGNKALLNSGGLAVVGSRNASDADLEFASLAGAKAAAEDVTIISGGARGVDEAAMLGALQANGTVTGVLADNLLKAATSVKWRRGLMNGNLVLVSPFYPEAGFSASNAMARNKYIYCLAESALVVHAGAKGGTVSGAEENLRKSWVPLWVKPSQDSHSANPDLVAKGGRWCSADIRQLSISALNQAENVHPEQSDLFAPETQSLRYSAEVAPLAHSGTMREEAPPYASPETPISTIDFYHLFLAELPRFATNPITLDECIAATGLNKHQLNDWLTRATDDGLVQKLNRPVRYQWVIK